MLWAGFVFGLLGSFHCVGMCGAIALALPGAGQRRARYVAGRVLYNLGRVSTYTALGLLAGVLGQSLRLTGLQQGLSVASGVLILLLVAVPERHTGRAAALLGLDRPLFRLKQALAYFFQRPALGALFLSGVLNGLLPCGLVYLALAGALSAPDLGGSAAYMALFGLRIPEWRLISVLAEHGGMSQQALCGHTRRDKVTVSRAAIALAGRGLIERRPNPVDQRSHLLSLTPDGRALYEQVVPKALV